MEKECACPEAAAAINSGVSATTCPTEEMIHLSRPSAPSPRDQDEDHVVQFHVNPGVTVSLQVGDSVRVVKGAFAFLPFLSCVSALVFSCCFCVYVFALISTASAPYRIRRGQPTARLRSAAPRPSLPSGHSPALFLGNFAVANFTRRNNIR